MTPPLSPAAFVALVEPHLPVGPYTRIEGIAWLAIVRIGTLDPTRATCDLFLSDAANLLLGAIVAEAGWMSLCNCDGDTIIRFDPFDDNVAYRGVAHGTDTIAKLTAALLARAEARKP